ncbi:MAG: YeeE/YedE family protein [Alphaproteobacteria bacterium]|nr:YeeE/YedE family protein [Alphaproteobacteria bacterium]
MNEKAIVKSQKLQNFGRGQALSALAALILVFMIYQTAGLTNALLSLVGIMIGLTLVYGQFGFTGGWSAWINQRDGRGLRAQMLILALASAIFYPVLASGSLFGSPVTGFVSPIGMASIFGSFLFGIGMQLGGCCASGALSWAGAGSTRIIITLFGFILGGMWGAYDIAFWRSLPGMRISLTDEFGVIGGLGVTILICATVAFITLIYEKRHHGRILPFNGEDKTPMTLQRVISGNWPLIAVILLLVLANFLTLMLAGRPWGVTSAFVLWGSKVATFTGADVTGWAYWQNAAPLSKSVFYDVTSVMNFGILLGALVAAQMMGTFKPQWNITPKMIIVSIIGGLLLGYGSRIAYGCNIGAFFSGVSSASLSGWIWFVSAFIGNLFGNVLKKRFAL